MVTEVAGEEPGVRVFVVQSEERLAFERAMREAAMEKTAKLWRNSLSARILSRNHEAAIMIGTLEQGVFRYFEHPVQRKKR